VLGGFGGADPDIHTGTTASSTRPTSARAQRFRLKDRATREATELAHLNPQTQEFSIGRDHDEHEEEERERSRGRD
jgi:hypothetical protein